jgi:chromosome segregation ATPase
MKRFLTFLFFISALGLFAYEFNGYFFPPKPCAEPIPYTLGEFSGEFKVSKEYFLGAVADAEAVWEDASGRELFTYSPEDKESDVLKINLIYDYRQAATAKLGRIGSALEENQTSYDALRAEFESSRRQYERDRESLEAAVKAFNQKQDAYEAEVRYWNAKGGAPEKEYQKLEKELQALKAEADELRQREAQVNQSAQQVNELVAELNALAKKLNLSVENYNTVSGSRGETFEEGLYVRDGFKKEINIYEFEDRAELVRLLAHELGHALSLDHVPDPDAIMYELNESENIKPTSADLRELNAKCGAPRTKAR